MVLSVTSALAPFYDVRKRGVWAKIRKALHHFLILVMILSKDIPFCRQMYTLWKLTDCKTARVPIHYLCLTTQYLVPPL